ncbi:UPF0057-domain-containing protein [Corynespora cassiicola Philippines]|uniref:UPF0057-domain-containing protein n=1 Tax=Corynespora cassiicola Philippines TaxID=1448308 RepID=A0A2T2PAP4_CORCC|nr:UPF0057-domain-containing protein [Corynespora cassiicola Philippines]
MLGTLVLILITIFIPPIGVFMVAGCGMDLFINILLTILGYFPGHIHAFYIEYVYYKRKDAAKMGVYDTKPAPGVYSERVQRGGKHHRPAAATAEEPVAAPAGQGQYGAI